MRILNSAQMRDADRRTIDDIGIPAIVLMENAGRQVVAAMEASFEDLGDKSVAVLCGRGNNGGDGFVVARTLLQRGVDVSVFVVGSARRHSRRSAHEPRDSRPARPHGRRNRRQPGLGTALLRDLGVRHHRRRALRDGAEDTAPGNARDSRGRRKRIHASRSSPWTCRQACRPTATTLIGDCIDATVTITLAAPKLPLVLPPAELHAGDIVIADIGIPSEVIDSVDGPRTELLTRASCDRSSTRARQIPTRATTATC